MKSIMTPPWRYPRDSSLAWGSLEKRCSNMQRMFGTKMAKTCGRWAGRSRRKSSVLGLRKNDCAVERMMRRKKEQLSRPSASQLSQSRTGLCLLHIVQRA